MLFLVLVFYKVYHIQTEFFLLVGPTLSKEEKELERRKALKKIRVKYGLQVTMLDIVSSVQCTKHIKYD